MIGVGGYASGPTLLASLPLRWLGLRVYLLEQNSTPGLTNRVLSRFATQSYSAFPWPRFEVVDLPLRRPIRMAAKNIRSVNWPAQSIFILGGSQGARGLNQKWRQIFPELRKKYPINVIHQTGKAELEDLKKFYSSLGASAEVFAFSDKILDFYERADLLICRAGALTLFECMKLKRPALLIPFPAATDDHQWKNAKYLQDSSWVVREAEWNGAVTDGVLSSSEPRFLKRVSGVALSEENLITQILS